MAFNFLQSLTAHSQNTDDEGTPVDEFDDNADESDIELDLNEEEEVDGDIDSSDDPDQSNEDESLDLHLDLDLRDANLYQWSEELKPVEINLFTELVGPKTEDLDLTQESRPIDFFNLFFTRDLVENIATQTNLYATQRQAKNFKLVTTRDIDIFLYLNFMFGIHKLPCYYHYWSTDPLLRVPQVADAMSRKRYTDIGKYLHINDNATAVAGGQDGYDQLFKIRPVINCVKQACNTLFRPGAAISFDEAMIPFRGRLWFKQYIKGKPHPWGIKVWCCCDSATSFLLDFDFYTGKGQADYPHGLGYHVFWTLGQP
ncbi:PiggyBac transposable element-derived protein 4-like [Plakobranchus ocellatus]|uniref:PiggyBac transposable element-derived protein 4-like n=1 Tax=Plakobranchus ocellatus TaxID=259542 RepID=A0AAV4CI78_9GAST|nr:PiggyBac transposable element-derived protein 4-like [Plakobranchus ocellatus]